MKQIYVVQIAPGKFAAYMEKEDIHCLDNISPFDSIDKIQGQHTPHETCLLLADGMGMSYQNKNGKLPPYFFKEKTFLDVCDTFQYKTLYKLGLRDAELIHLNGSIPKTNIVTIG